MSNQTEEQAEPCSHIEPAVVGWMRSLGFVHTNKMGGDTNMVFNHKLFVNGKMSIFEDQATFFYKLISKQKENWEKEAVERAFDSISTEASDYRSMGHSFDYDKAMKAYVAHLSSNKPKEAFDMELKIDPKVPDNAIRFDHENHSAGFIFDDNSNQNKEG